jgi:hypothetical protein
MVDIVDESICRICGVNEATWDSEPPRPGYTSRCWRCFCLIGYNPQGLGHHQHLTPARGQFPAYHTAVTLYPRFTDGVLQGWECRGHGAEKPCGYVQPLYERYLVRKHRGNVTVFDFHTAEHQGELRITEQQAHELCARLNYAHHGNAKTWPRVKPDGVMVYACCLSEIGPPCRHRAQA